MDDYFNSVYPCQCIISYIWLLKKTKKKYLTNIVHKEIKVQKKLKYVKS